MKTQMIMRWIAWSTIGISLLLYVLACALPSGVVVGIDPEDEVRGIWCLVGGWTAVFFSKEALLKYPLMTIFNAFVSLSYAEIAIPFYLPSTLTFFNAFS